jgi:hypothetical protein
VVAATADPLEAAVVIGMVDQLVIGMVDQFDDHSVIMTAGSSLDTQGYHLPLRHPLRTGVFWQL